MAHWPIESLSCNVCLSCVPLFAVLFKRLITPHYKDRKSNPPFPNGCYCSHTNEIQCLLYAGFFLVNCLLNDAVPKPLGCITCCNGLRSFYKWGPNNHLPFATANCNMSSDYCMHSSSWGCTLGFGWMSWLGEPILWNSLF